MRAEAHSNNYSLSLKNILSASGMPGFGMQLGRVLLAHEKPLADRSNLAPGSYEPRSVTCSDGHSFYPIFVSSHPPTHASAHLVASHINVLSKPSACDVVVPSLIPML